MNDISYKKCPYCGKRLKIETFEHWNEFNGQSNTVVNEEKCTCVASKLMNSKESTIFGTSGGGKSLYTEINKK